MSRDVLGFVAVHLLFAVPGFALLFALGLIRRARDLLFALGPAYLSGLALVLPVLILALVLGIPVRLTATVATATVLSVALTAIVLVAARHGRRWSPLPPPAPMARLETWATRAGIAAMGLYLAIGTSAFAKLATVGDDWEMWSYKALGFYYFGGLQPEIFAGAAPGPTHLDYPVLWPLLDSLFYRATGGPHLPESHMVLWIIFAAAVWTIGFLLRSRGVAMAVILPVLGAVAVTYGAISVTSMGYVDIVVASFTAIGALSIGLWLDGGGARYALLGAVFLTAAANTKNEGLIAAVAILLVSAGVIRFARLHGWRVWAGVVAVVAVGALPWVVWRASHNLSNTDVYPLAHSLNPSFLVDHAGRLNYSVGKSIQQLANGSRWLGIVPAFLVVALACVVGGRARRQAAYYLATATVLMLSLWWVYWTGRLEIGSWVFYSVDRVTAGVILVAAIGLMHLAALVLPRPTGALPPGGTGGGGGSSA